MSAHQIETAFLSSVILYDDSDEPRKLRQSIAQLQHDEQCVRRLALVMALFLMLGLAGVGYGGILHENFPYNLPDHVIQVFCVLVLASLICIVAFAALLAVYRRKLNRLREECRRLVARLLESHLDKPLQRRLAAIENRTTAKFSTAQRSQVREAARRSLDDAVEQLSPEL